MPSELNFANLNLNFVLWKFTSISFYEFSALSLFWKQFCNFICKFCFMKFQHSVYMLWIEIKKNILDFVLIDFWHLIDFALKFANLLLNFILRICMLALMFLSILILKSILRYFVIRPGCWNMHFGNLILKYLFKKFQHSICVLCIENPGKRINMNYPE